MLLKILLFIIAVVIYFLINFIDVIYIYWTVLLIAFAVIAQKKHPGYFYGGCLASLFGGIIYFLIIKKDPTLALAYAFISMIFMSFMAAVFSLTMKKT